ncbi:Retinitis pigmentosa 1-like 1 protein [Bagarius yarrelli]|uniref:Retinitis pigmentosa 1-like 1 protein n=1 Tax=Bagarius yarrelli TaxID=175774 RepID=A0A556TSY6_BAGYA|nr:Retinitis pigmentosa 1-like 1 protein [Bagarius yarrelli]
MTSHKHSFQCFDAVVEKPALTAGHNYALPHSCTCTSVCLEQLDNRRCSLCLESQQIKPVTSEVIENQPATCSRTHSPDHQHTPRKPRRPEGDPVYRVAHHRRNHHHHQYHNYRHRKRIVLVKNSNPSIQRTILLHCKPVHSLSVFMEDVSELMHCLIRKLYTLDGCKVDSVQSLLHGPSILVCVGHEPFYPLLLNSFQKNFEDKLPKLILKSQSSTCNEDQGDTKNVNIGLKSKKDIPPGPFPKVRENTLDDDVEKRVLVNKDGSLSVEMKVRFRLLNDESLHCSTKIKKSSCASNVCNPGQDNVYYSHCGHSKSWSEVESLSASEAEDVYISKLSSQKHTEEPHSQHCCAHCQEYDIWKSLKHIESARFSVASDKIKCKKEYLDSVYNTSCEEYMEQVVEKARIQHTIGQEEEGDNTVQYCSISRCSSRSEVCSVFTKKAGYTDDQDRKNESTQAFSDKRKNHVSSNNINQDPMSVEITQVFIEDERSVSVETNSSEILTSLKEDEDKEENDLFLGNSRSYKENDERMPSTEKSPCAFLPCKPPESPNHSVSTRTSSIASNCSVKSQNSRKVGVKKMQGNVLTTPQRCQNEDVTDVTIKNVTTEENLEAVNQSKDDFLEADMRSESDLSKTCDYNSDDTEKTVECKERKNAKLQKGESLTSLHTKTSAISKHSTVSELPAYGSVHQTEEAMIRVCTNLSRSSQLSDLETSELEEIEYQREYSSPSIMSVKSSISEDSPVKLGKVQSAESISALSTKTNISVRSITSKTSEGTPADMLIERVPSTTSVKSDISVSSKSSNVLDVSLYHSESVEEALEDRASSANSNKASLKLNTMPFSTGVTEKADVLEEESLRRPSSVISSISLASVRSTNSKPRNKNDNSLAGKTEQFQDRCISSVIPSNPRDSEIQKDCKTSEDMLEKYGDFEATLEEQTPQSRFTKLNKVRKSKKIESEKMETGTERKEERPLSTTSSKSRVSLKSEKCQFSEAKQECEHPEERHASVMSKISAKSKKSVVSDAPCQNKKKETEHIGRRSQNALSVRAHKSKKSKASGASRPDTGNEDNRERTPSVISCRSSLSDGSNPVPDEVPHLGATDDLLKETESAYEDRPASALSSESQISSLSIKSKDLSQERAHTSMSAKSNVSTKSTTKSSKVEKALILTSHISNAPATNLEKAAVSPAEVEDRCTERSLSAVSGQSKVSETSNKNSVVNHFKEPVNAYEEKSPSAMSTKSNVTVRSKISDAHSTENISQTGTSDKKETSNCSLISNDSLNVKFKSHMTDKSSKSVKCNILALAGGQTDTVGLNKRSKSAMSGLKILMTEVSNNNDIKERAPSALSNKSNSSSVHPTSESVCASVSIGIVEDYDDNDEEDNSVSYISQNSPQLCPKCSVKTIETKNRHHMQTPEDRAASSLTEETAVSDKFQRSECDHKDSHQPVTDNEVANNTTAKKKSKKSSRSLSSKSAYSDLGLSKTKVPPEVDDKPQSNTTNTPMYLKVNEKHSKPTAGKRSKSNLSSDRYSKKKEEMSRPHSADVPIGSVFIPKSKEAVLSLFACDNSSPSNKNAKKSNTTGDLNICGKTCNASLVATDASRNINDTKSEKTSISSCKQNTSFSAQKRDNDPSELVPSTLPSSSPTEVVNEWLKKIPIDSPLYDVEDEFHVNCEEEEEALAETLTQYESGNENERDSSAAMLRPDNDEDVEGVINNKCKLGNMKKTDKDHTGVENIQPCTFPDAPPTVHLMKILLSPKLDRCNSLLEVSPVYGRKLSMSARGFLDSLVNLQLLDGKAEKYNDLTNMLQSLWLCDHHESVTFLQTGEFNNLQNFDEEFDEDEVNSFLDSSFHDPGKSSFNDSTLTFKSQTNTHSKGFEVPTKIQESIKTENEIESKSNSARCDIARQVQWTPENETEEEMKESNELSVVSNLTIRNVYSLTEETEKAFISDHEQDTHLESPSSEQLPHLTEKISQDPDPIWVLNLLNNIEKQFMTHYSTAMAEFKVQWNLNNDEQLDVTISKLKDEVHEKIQASINNELKKIQGHLRIPSPPKGSAACKSSSEKSEQRCRQLKVNLSQSIDPAVRAKIKEKDKEEVCDDLAEGKGCAEGETISKDSETEENIALEAETVKQEVAEREFTDGKETDVETSDKETEDETVKNKKISNQGSTGEVNRTAEEVTAIESGGKYDYEKEKHKDTTDENKTNEKDDTAEEENSKCTDNKDKIANSEFSFEEKISDPAEDGDKAEQESAEEDNLMNSESAEVRETDIDELDSEGNKIKAETAEDEESAESKTYKYKENLYDDLLDRKEIIQIGTEELAQVKMAYNGNMSEAETLMDDDCESAEDFKQAQTAEDTSDDKAQYGETSKDKNIDIGEISKVDDDSNECKSEIAKDRDRDDDEISEISEMPYDETNEAKSTEHQETHDDIISDEEETSGAVVKDIAEEDYNDDDDDDDDDDDGEDDDVNEDVDDTEIVEDAHETIDLQQFVENKMNILNGQNNSKETANKQVNYENVQDTEMDTSHSEEDNETPDADIDHKKRADDGTENNDNMADGESTDDGETSNNTFDDKNPPESDMEEDDKTTGTETAKIVGEQEDNKKADEEIRDNAIADDEATTGTDDAEDEETSGAKTEEDGEPANNGTTADGDTSDERETNNEEIFEHEIAQNGETGKATTEDCNESLVTDEGVNRETNESNTNKDVLNTHNIKTKPNSEMVHVIANTLSMNTGESDGEGADAEDESEPVVKRNGRVHGIKIPAMQPTKQSPRKADIKINSTVKMYLGCSEDGADADSEDSDTDLHNIYG